MWVGQVELSDFRNHRATSIHLDRGISLLIGRNGQGKTNFVEALVYFAQLSSHRVSSDLALVRAGAESAVIRCVVHHDKREVSLALEINAKGSNKAKVNGEAVRVSELLGWLKVVLFAPEDLDIVRGDPGMRRRFIDEVSVSINPSLHHVLGRFDKILRQRNALLKSARGRKNVAEELAAWDEDLATVSEHITQARQATVHALGPALTRAYGVIAPGDQVSLSLVLPPGMSGVTQSSPLRDHYLALLRERRLEEIERGMTLVGPHRDDLDITLKGLLARTHASHGEAWSLALALKIAVAEVLREQSPSGDPIIVLDDVLAELDHRRRAAVADLVGSYDQVLITAAVEEDIPEALTGRIFSVSAGEVTARA